MVTLLEGIARLLILLVSAAFVGTAIRTNSREQFPGKRSFVVTCLLIALMLGAYTLFRSWGLLVARACPGGLLCRPVAAFGFVIMFVTFAAALGAPLAWLRFALTFTGQRIPTDRRTFLRIGLPILFALATVGLWVSIPVLSFVIGQKVLPDRFYGMVINGSEYILSFTVFYLAGLLVVGASLIGWTSYTYRHLSNKGGAMLGVGILLPWVALSIPWVSGFSERPTLLTYHAAVGGVVGIIVVWSAVGRHRQFDRVPAAGTVGREVTVEEMNDPVIVIDDDKRAIDVNAAAERAFDAAESVGAPLQSILGEHADTDRLISDSTSRAEIPWETKVYEASTSELSDQYGRLLGHSVVFHDITERKRREQRIQVLNRVLRHNLRNDLNAVNGYAELLEEQSSDPGNYAIQIQEVATKLISVGEKAREIEKVVATRRAARTGPLVDVIEQAVTEVRSEFEGCEIRAEWPTENPAVNSLVLTSVLRELMENACRHNDADDPIVEVTAHVDSTAEYAVEIEVSDNGPGIPDHELAPLEEGAESALEHGSGLGLWLVEWGVTTLNGEIEFGPNEPRGTVATLRLNPETSPVDPASE